MNGPEFLKEYAAQSGGAASMSCAPLFMFPLGQSHVLLDHRTGLQEPTTDSVISSAVGAKIIGFNRAPHEAQNRRCPAQNPERILQRGYPAVGPRTKTRRQRSNDSASGRLQPEWRHKISPRRTNLGIVRTLISKSCENGRIRKTCQVVG